MYSKTTTDVLKLLYRLEESYLNLSITDNNFTVKSRKLTKTIMY